MLGSDWGGWTVVPSLLSKDSIVYSGGIGTDASFDTAIIDRFGCEVHGFDPTPRGLAHAEEIAKGEPRFRFYPCGLWHEDTTVLFYAPANPGHDSYSIVNLQSTAEERAVEAPVRRLSSITRDLGHDHVDLLKIDIEGAEHAVLASMLDDAVDVRQICVEFDQPTPMARMIGTIQRLQTAGFTAVARRGWEWTFVRDAQ
jgi:FkbM family methyltransferase